MGIDYEWVCISKEELGVWDRMKTWGHYKNMRFKVQIEWECRSVTVGKKWYAHMEWLIAERLMKWINRAGVEETRGRCRPRILWLDMR